MDLLNSPYLQNKILNYVSEKELLDLLFIKPFHQIIQQKVNEVEIDFCEHQIPRNAFYQNKWILILKLVEHLKKHEISIHDFWNYGLYGACEGGHLDLALFAIKKGANQWDYGFEHACLGGHLDLIELMIEKGANNWNNGLVAASIGGQINIVKLMISKGANHLDRALWLACLENHPEVADLLIAGGAKDFNDVLFHACLRKNYRIIKFIISKGADYCECCSRSMKEHLK